MSRPVKSHNFRGKKYRIKKMPPSQMNKKTSGSKRVQTLGLCDSPTRKNKALLFDSTLKDFPELDVNIHEAIHACFWDLDEEAVEESSIDIARFLWRLGYRKVK